MVSLDPSSLDGVLAGIVAVGRATGTEELAATAVGELRGRLARVRSAVAGRRRPATVALEWGDRPCNAGHWVPEMIELAGGAALLASRGMPSKRITWEDVADAAPEAVVFMPCGYDLDGALAQVPQLLERPELAPVPAVVAAGASGNCSRPVATVEALAAVLHGGCGAEVAPGAIARVR